MAEAETQTATPAAPTPSEQAILDSGRPQPATSPTVDDRPEPPHAVEEHRKYVREHGRRAAAKPEDVPTIRTLAGLVKELTPASDADRPRVKELKAKVRAALELDIPAESARPAPRPDPAPLPPAPFVPGAFDEPEPRLDDFLGKSEDPYAAHVRAQSAWDRRKESHEAQRGWAAQEQQRHQQAVQAAWDQTAAQFAQQVNEAKATKYTDWDRVVPGVQATGLLNSAVIAMPTGADATYYLAKHPDFLNELNLQSLSLPSTALAVTLLQQRITQRMTAGTTGATVPARPVLVAPRPPTPVRTSPLRTGEAAAPPGDDDDLTAHRAYYGVGGSRRRG